MSMTTTSGTVLNGLYVGSSTPVANQKGLLIDNKYFIPLVESSSPGTDTSDATATASDILQDKTAYVNGEKITGTISSYTGSSLIIPGVEDKVLSTAEGIYLPKAVKVAGESDLLAENIKKGVSIFGIVGTLESSGGTSAEYYKCASVSAEAATPEGVTFTMQLTLNALSITSTYHWVMDDTSKTGTERTWTGTVKGDSGTHTLHFNGTYWQVVDGLGNTTATETADDPWDITNWHNADGGDVSCTFSDVSSASTGSKTWSGYKAVFDSGAGTWSFEDTVTAGLEYKGLTPVVNKIYSADTTIQIGYIKLAGILNDETVKFLLYPKSSGTLEDISTGGNGVTVTNTGNVVIENNRIVFGAGKALTISANTLPDDIFVAGKPLLM